MLRRCRLRSTHGVGSRKSIDQPGLELIVDFPVGMPSLTGIGGVLVMRRGVEFFGHIVPPFGKLSSLHLGNNVLNLRLFRISSWPRGNLRVSEAELSAGGT